MLANLGVPWEGGGAGGGEWDLAAEGAAASGGQQPESEGGIRELLPRREPDPPRVLQNAADEYLAAGQGEGPGQAGAEEEVGQRRPKPGDEYWGSGRAKNAPP